MTDGRFVQVLVSDPIFKNVISFLELQKRKRILDKQITDAMLNWDAEKLADAARHQQLSALIGSNQTIYGLILLQPLAEECEVLLILTAFDLRGVGQELLRFIKSKWNSVHLEVHENNQVAIDFYKNQGFKVLGQRKGYYKDGAAALLMRWQEKE